MRGLRPLHPQSEERTINRLVLSSRSSLPAFPPGEYGSAYSAGTRNNSIYENGPASRVDVSGDGSDRLCALLSSHGSHRRCSALSHARRTVAALYIKQPAPRPSIPDPILKLGPSPRISWDTDRRGAPGGGGRGALEPNTQNLAPNRQTPASSLLSQRSRIENVSHRVAYNVDCQDDAEQRNRCRSQIPPYDWHP